jgi:threonine dehydrogenase-like Zn-dependent dehydrogenase
VVFGAGPVGLIVAQILKAKGASRVYVVDRLESRLAIARGLGLDTLIADDDGAAQELKGLHGSEAFPVVWECTGSTAALHDAIRVVRRQGAVIAVGFYQGDARNLYLGEEFHHNGVRIVSGQIGNIHPTMDMASLRKETLELVRRGDLVLGRLPRLAIAVEDVAQGFRSLSRPSAVLQVALTY